MTGQARPFDDIRALLKAMPGPDEAAAAAVRARDAELTKPAGALGRLEEIVAVARGLAGRGAAPCRPAAGRGLRRQSRRRRPGRLAVSAIGDAGDGRQFRRRRRGDQPDLQDIRPRPQGVRTRARNPDRRHHPGPRRSTSAPARRRWPSAWRRSPRDPDLLCLGEMGIGNTTVAAAICHALWGGRAEDWVGRGTGVDDAGLARKAAAVRRRSRCIASISPIPSKSCAGSAGARSRRSRARSSPRGSSACRAARRLRGLRGRGVLQALDPTRARPLPRRPCLGRKRPSRGAAPARQDAAARSRHAARRRLGRGARGRDRQGRARLPPRHGDLRGSGGRRQGRLNRGRRPFRSPAKAGPGPPVAGGTRALAARTPPTLLGRGVDHGLGLRSRGRRRRPRRLPRLVAGRGGGRLRRRRTHAARPSATGGAARRRRRRPPTWNWPIRPAIARSLARSGRRGRLLRPSPRSTGSPDPSG